MSEYIPDAGDMESFNLEEILEDLVDRFGLEEIQESLRMIIED